MDCVFSTEEKSGTRGWERGDFPGESVEGSNFVEVVVGGVL